MKKLAFGLVLMAALVLSACARNHNPSLDGTWFSAEFQSRFIFDGGGYILQVRRVDGTGPWFYQSRGTVTAIDSAIFKRPTHMHRNRFDIHGFTASSEWLDSYAAWQLWIAQFVSLGQLPTLEELELWKGWWHPWVVSHTLVGNNLHFIYEGGITERFVRQ